MNGSVGCSGITIETQRSGDRHFKISETAVAGHAVTTSRSFRLSPTSSLLATIPNRAIKFMDATRLIHPARATKSSCHG